ncbi:MAG TPA: response regulator [Phycisphaerae bacterium]|jgi:CheY-like chemotaxis protein|nr:response regulator [Phycisphaerae bacterium]
MSTKVLVVEDDQEINELLGEYLSLENMEYLSATSGQEAIHLAMREHPDAIVLDVMLPDIDGFEVARTLTSQRSTYDIPIVILSCMCQECDKEKGYAHGAMFYMNKPFMPDDLLGTLRQALEWREMLKRRPPMGTLMLGDGEGRCSQALHQMVADLFARTELPDPAVAQIRETMETLRGWMAEWNKEHGSHEALRVDYKVDGRVMGAVPGDRGTEMGQAVEWTLSEAKPGMLADAFFTAGVTANGGGGSGIGGGVAAAAGAVAGAITGWGGGTLVTRPLAPIAPPARWLQVLAKTGASRFEKDSRSHVVKFTRPAGRDGAVVKGSSVPVVEIDGNRYPTRLRDEALAAKQ